MRPWSAYDALVRVLLREPHWRETIACFERGAYWDAHEALEPHWLGVQGVERSFAAGVILLAAALHKGHAMGSPRGGRRNYAKALRHLALVPDVYAETDVRGLEAAVHAALRDPDARPGWPWADLDDATDGAARAPTREASR